MRASRLISGRLLRNSLTESMDAVPSLANSSEREKTEALDSEASLAIR